MGKSVTFAENLVQIRRYTLEIGEKRGTRKVTENLEKPKSISEDKINHNATITTAPPLSREILKNAWLYLKTEKGRSVEEVSQYPKLKSQKIETLRLFPKKETHLYQAEWYLKKFKVPFCADFSRERIEEFSTRHKNKL